MNSPLLLDDLLSRADKGSDKWWRAVARIGTPLQRPMTNGDVGVTFLWRDPEGVESDYRHVYLDVYSHTPHPTKELTSMTRVDGTNIWLWQTQLHADWCGSYFLMPAKQNQLPPQNGDRKAIRRWWIGLMQTNAQADPLNILPSHNNGSGIGLSKLQLPQASVRSEWSLSGMPLIGKLRPQRWVSKRLGNTRDVWIYSTYTSDSVQDLPLVILLDGHYWARHMSIFSPLDALTAKGELPPAVYVLIESLPEFRGEELTCNANFWLALQAELLPQIRPLQAFTRNPQRTLVAGQSFGGLAALYAALHWPQRFGVVLSQSGSFWWPDADETGEQGELTQAVIAGLGKGENLRILLEVGCYEPDMIGVNHAIRDALADNKHCVDYREYRGGHDWLCWRDGLLNGLSTLLNAIPHF